MADFNYKLSEKSAKTTERQPSNGKPSWSSPTWLSLPQSWLLAGGILTVNGGPGPWNTRKDIPISPWLELCRTVSYWGQRGNREGTPLGIKVVGYIQMTSLLQKINNGSLGFELMSFTQSILSSVLDSDWLESGTGLLSAHPQVSWGWWRVPEEVSKGTSGDHVFSVQSFETAGRIRRFQLNILFSVSEWPQLSSEKHKDLGKHYEMIKVDIFFSITIFNFE